MITPMTSNIGRRDSTILRNSFSNQQPGNPNAPLHRHCDETTGGSITRRLCAIRNAALTRTAEPCMNRLKLIVILLTGGLMVLNTFAADAPDRPLHVLYLGTVDVGRSGPRAGGGFGGFGTPRTNYVFLPGQTL